VDKIAQRSASVQFFYDDAAQRKDIRGLLDRVYDIDRLSNKISMGTANARDMTALSASLKSVRQLKDRISGDLSHRISEITGDLDDFKDVTCWIDECIVDEPPVSIREGGMIRPGYNAEVDEIRGMITNGKDWLTGLKTREIQRTGINSLKIGYNKVFGYYIEVTKSNLGSIPEDYVRKQTLVNAERFITDELKKYESKIIGAEDRIKTVEYDIFCTLRGKVAKEMERLKKAADSTAELDVLTGLAEAAVRNGYVKPEVNKGSVISVTEGRHPVLERLLKDKEFVPNDIRMGEENGDIFIITGSNMAGKSTFIRQTALITIMAQMGSFVPAKQAVIGVVDRVFTRVGASDRLHRGMSTFMVEMLETANILNNATSRSLIVLDEIGRGTSTFDGVSIAWAVVEHINSRLKGAKTMFATHFHEITELAQVMKRVKNYNLAVREWKDEVIFLYRVVEGNCDESFGIHVAKLAGMPEGVVKRARTILNNLQRDSLLGNIRTRFSPDGSKEEVQLDLFQDTRAESPVVNKIRGLDVDNLTPMEALEKIAEFKYEIEEKRGKNEDTPS